MKVGDEIELGKSYPIGTRFLHDYNGSMRHKHILELVSKEGKFALKDLTQGDYWGPNYWLPLKNGKAIVSCIVDSDLIITHLPNQEINTMRTIPTKEQVLEVAKRCPQTKKALEILFPEDFKREGFKVKKFDIVEHIGRSSYVGQKYIVVPRYEGSTLDLYCLTIPGEWWGVDASKGLYNDEFKLSKVS